MHLWNERLARTCAPCAPSAAFHRKSLPPCSGTTKQVVSRYENGQRTPKVTVVEKFARRLGRAAFCPAGRRGRGRRALRVPVLGYVRAGIPLTAVEEILDYEEVPPALAHLGELFALKIKGDSMEPRMVEGDVVICRQTPGCRKRRHRRGAGERRRGHRKKTDEAQKRHFPGGEQPGLPAHVLHLRGM